MILLRLLVACGLGLVIGIDREARDRPAGLRTHMLTALAAAVFTIIAIEMIETFGAGGRQTQLDPIRVVEAVTAGVAILGSLTGIIVLLPVCLLESRLFGKPPIGNEGNEDDS